MKCNVEDTIKTIPIPKDNRINIDLGNVVIVSTPNDSSGWIEQKLLENK